MRKRSEICEEEEVCNRTPGSELAGRPPRATDSRNRKLEKAQRKLRRAGRVMKDTEHGWGRVEDNEGRLGFMIDRYWGGGRV